jgi:hypothetical protein
MSRSDTQRGLPGEDAQRSFLELITLKQVCKPNGTPVTPAFTNNPLVFDKDKITVRLNDYTQAVAGNKQEPGVLEEITEEAGIKV